MVVTRQRRRPADPPLHGTHPRHVAFRRPPLPLLGVRRAAPAAEADARPLLRAVLRAAAAVEPREVLRVRLSARGARRLGRPAPGARGGLRGRGLATPRALRVNLRRGFWRLTFVGWLVVVAAIVGTLGALAEPSPLRPFQEIGADGSPRPELPAECVVATPGEDAPALSLRSAWERLERLGCDGRRAELESWQAGAAPAYRTSAYWSRVRTAALAVAGASASIWILYGLLVWAAAGFRAQG